MAGRPGRAGSFPKFENEDLIKKISLSQNSFTRDLYLTLAKDSTENLFFSPFSIMTAMSMVHMGTAGNTADQLHKALHFDEEKSSLKKAFQELIACYQKGAEGYELHTSNMMYVSDKLNVLEDFAKTITEYFHSSSKTVDFGDSETVRKEINDVVEKETKEKIKDLIPSGVLTSLTRMVLVNAIYFKGLWQNQFDASSTEDQKFYITPEKSVQIPMMNIEKNFRYSVLKDLSSTLLSMDYQGGRLSMIVVLPDEKDGLADLEAKLATADLSSIDKKATSVKVKVTMPKFKLEESYQLPKVLEKMGIEDLFNSKSCDLSGISGDKSLHVSDVIHKAFIEVNEKGTEAAAATAAVIGLRCMRLPQQPEPFIVDHPFIFFIKDRLCNKILFFGRFLHPNSNSTKDEL